MRQTTEVCLSTPKDFDAADWNINPAYLTQFAADHSLDNVEPIDVDGDGIGDMTEAASELVMQISSDALVMELNDEDTSGMVDGTYGTITLEDGAICCFKWCAYLGRRCGGSYRFGKFG